ncbi:MAG: hypothetical protein FWC11_04460 [Firmicutes bacterium]|nr:hypothetical protein [Bacillota bacterium]MCL2256094.1 hypothetical protein [Bacillota bacterium]
MENISKDNSRQTELRQILFSISQDCIQVQMGAIIPDWIDRVKKFQESHMELRALEGKEPRTYIGSQEFFNQESMDFGQDNFISGENFGFEQQPNFDNHFKNNFEENTCESNSAFNDEQVTQLQIESLQKELQSINEMMNSFAQSGHSEHDFIQLQQAQLEIIKQIQQLKQ